MCRCISLCLILHVRVECGYSCCVVCNMIEHVDTARLEIVRLPRHVMGHVVFNGSCVHIGCAMLIALPVLCIIMICVVLRWSCFCAYVLWCYL